MGIGKGRQPVDRLFLRSILITLEMSSPAVAGVAVRRIDRARQRPASARRAACWPLSPSRSPARGQVFEHQGGAKPARAAFA